MKKKKSHPILRVVWISFLVSVLISVSIMFMANDVFALVGGEKDEITVVIPEYADG